MRRQSATYMFLLLLTLAPGHSQTGRWVYTYNGSGYWDDEVHDIAYGADGSIYLAGKAREWQTGDDFLVISLTSSGSERWVYRYDWVGILDYATNICYGTDGNLYVAGVCCSSIVARGVVISLNTDGGVRWIKQTPWVADYSLADEHLVYGSDGNIYGVGSVGIWSMTSSGVERWIYNADTSFQTSGEIAYGADGNIYVGGYRQRAGISVDFAVLSLTPQGSKRWVYTYDGVGEYTSHSSCVHYGSDGNIYAGGQYGMNPVTYEYIVASITTSGDERWVYRNGLINTSNTVLDIEYGEDNNIHTTGSMTLGNYPYCVVISLTPSGIEGWMYSDSIGILYSIVYGADGNVYAAGHWGWVAPYQYHSVVSVTTMGNVNWTYDYYQFGWSGQIRHIAYGADGYLYVAGEVDTGGVNEKDILVISLDPAIGVEEQSMIKLVENHNGVTTTIFSGPPQLPEGKKCRVFDITGRIVQPDKIQPGIYFIEVDGVVTQKVIKVR